MRPPPGSTSRCGAPSNRSPTSFQQALRFVGRRRVAIALTQADGRLEVFVAGGPVAGLQRELAELQVAAAVDPVASFVREGGGQVGPRLGGAPETASGEPALV